MKQSITQNNFLAYLLVLLAFFVLIFFTRNIFSQTQALMDERNAGQKEYTERREELQELDALRAKLEANEDDIIEKITPLTHSLDSSSILKYLYDEADKMNSESQRVLYRDIDIKFDDTSDTGFNVVDVTISVIFAGENTMLSFISALLAPSAPYKITIPDFSYPMNEKSGNLQVSLPLKIYYTQ